MTGNERLKNTQQGLWCQVITTILFRQTKVSLTVKIVNFEIVTGFGNKQKIIRLFSMNTQLWHNVFNISTFRSGSLLRSFHVWGLHGQVHVVWTGSLISIFKHTCTCAHTQTRGRNCIQYQWTAIARHDKLCFHTNGEKTNVSTKITESRACSLF